MIVRFYDRQRVDSPLNGSSFEDIDPLFATLDSINYDFPFFFELMGENEFNILVGMGRVWSCAQYSSADGEPPYLMALHTGDNEHGADLEFLIENIATPVPYRFRLYRSQLKEILRCFIETGKYASSFHWEEI